MIMIGDIDFFFFNAVMVTPLPRPIIIGDIALVK